ncbi:MAG: hypothetical protein ACE14P_14075 [Methanotrichaceae archaeon]
MAEIGNEWAIRELESVIESLKKEGTRIVRIEDEIGLRNITKPGDTSESYEPDGFFNLFIRYKVK